MDGFNGTIMCYGQTGSGKTHSLLGSKDHPGIVPRAVAALAAGFARGADGATFTVSLSALEIYNERVRDLLGAGANLAVFDGAHVPGLAALPVSGEAECLRMMEQGLAGRAVAATAMNEASSRSHCVVRLTVEKTFSDGRVRSSKLQLVVRAQRG